MERKPSIVFFGTDYFAMPVLEKLPAFGNVIGVVSATQKPDNLKELLKKADIAVVGSYGKIIPASLLALPRMGFLNIHPSLLPKYRGPSPVPYTLLNDEKETGVTIIKMDEQVDHGPIIAQERASVGPDERFSGLIVRLWLMGADLLIKVLPDYLAGIITLIPQNDSEATFTKLMKKDDGKIELTDDPKVIYNKFRAYDTWPGIWFMHKDKRVKILEYKPGTIITLQPEGKKPMTLKDFENGYGPIHS